MSHIADERLRRLTRLSSAARPCPKGHGAAPAGWVVGGCRRRDMRPGPLQRTVRPLYEWNEYFAHLMAPEEHKVNGPKIHHTRANASLSHSMTCRPSANANRAPALAPNNTKSQTIWSSK